MSDQKTLFQTDWGGLVEEPKQDAELRRVSGKIAEVIREFRKHVGRRRWHMSELHEFAKNRENIAPESAGRVLRSLRDELPYTLISRSKSEYQFDEPLT